ncbi:MAG: GAF domain-containing protein, partial [Bdellovibrionales bacterium]|nr:GAF domain-containing protein [Bdellovibrionales bacterium]
VKSLDKESEGVGEAGLDLSQLLILSRLPLLLNSSLNTERLVKTALEHLRGGMNATAATVFQLDESGKQLRFWALTGGETTLANKVIPADKGIVGWVIQNKSGLIVNDPKTDPRFYHGFDKESAFETVNMICVPLMVRSQTVIGALQILNKRTPEGFLEKDLLIAERVAHQLALAIDNAELYASSEAMRKMLQQLDQRKGEMITVLTHELRTPLNVIAGAADLLGGEMPLVEEQRRLMADTLSRGVQRLVRLSQQLQSLARVQGKTVQVQRGTFPVNQLINNVAERFSKIAELRKISFHVAGANLLQPVVADESLIYLVLSNLLSNAIRFTQDGGSVTLSAALDHGLVTFSVSDTGIGIPKDELGNIFEKFYEVGDALVHSSGDFGFKSGGLGLGLSAAKAILEEHGTAMEVQSEVGRGSTFSFRLRAAG